MAKSQKVHITYDAGKLAARSPHTAALLSKLRESKNPVDKSFSKGGAESVFAQGQMQTLHHRIKMRMHDNENIIKLFPEIKIAKTILVSSTRSPKDMTGLGMNISAKETVFPSSLQSELNDLTRQRLSKTYKLDDTLSKELGDIYFDTGCDIRVILPENTLDDIINGRSLISRESVSSIYTKTGTGQEDTIRSFGFLGDKPDTKERLSLEEALRGRPTFTYTNRGLVGLESAYGDDLAQELSGLIDVQDNPYLLKLPDVKQSMIARASKELVYRQARGLEIYHSDISNPNRETRISRQELKAALFKGPEALTELIVEVPDPKTASRRAVSMPLVKKAPPESCIPVFMPGDPSRHVGYFFLVDIDGCFLSRFSVAGDTENLANMLTNQNNSDSVASRLLERSRKNIAGDSSDNVPVTQISRYYASVVERNLIDKLNFGKFNTKLDVKMSQEVQDIMLARALANKFTRLLFVPSSMVSYIAMEHDENGIGISFLDGVKQLTSIRGILLMSKVLGLVKNSIPVTDVKMKLDPRDQDPEHSIELGTHEVMRLRQLGFPFGINSMPDLADWVQRAGIRLSFEGHPDLPDVGFEFNNVKADHQMPEDDLEEELKKRMFQFFDIPSEFIEGAGEKDFAATVEQNQVLFANAIQNKQIALEPQYSARAQMILRYDPEHRKNVIELFNNHFKDLESRLTEEQKALYAANKHQFTDELYELYLENILFSFPRPNSTTHVNQKQAVEAYEEIVDKCIDYIINSEFAPADLTGQWAEKIDLIKAAEKARLMREFMADNNILPEVFGLVQNNEEDKPKIELDVVYREHFEKLASSTLKLIKAILPIKLASDIDITKATTPPEELEGVDPEITNAIAPKTSEEVNQGGLGMNLTEVEQGVPGQPLNAPQE